MASADEMLKGEMKMFPAGLRSVRVRNRSTAKRVFAALSCSMMRLQGRAEPELPAAAQANQQGHPRLLSAWATPLKFTETCTFSLSF